jgi:hypothetical protein
MSLPDDLHVQQQGTARVIALFVAQPLQWIDWREFQRIAPCAWRTRISDARKRLKLEGGQIEWNKQVRASAYRYVPYRPLGRDAGRVINQPALF